MMQPFTGSAAEWDRLVAGLPNPHLLQTWEWAQVKAAYGWEPMPFTWDGAAAMILKRRVTSRGFAARLCILYVPKGPAFDVADESRTTALLDDLQAFAHQQGAILIKIDPDVVLGEGVPGEPEAHENPPGLRFCAALQRDGWLFSREQVQFRNTVLVDLNASEDELLARMKQKTRYNIRLAEKKGVTVRTGTLDDLPMLYRMYAETSVRDHFVIRHEGYYRDLWQSFMRAHAGAAQSEPQAEPLIAEVDGEPVAAIFLFTFAGRAYYLHGMSRQAHREKMPNYLLQWAAMKRARRLGFPVYDLWGAPDEFKESDSLWGVYRFKEGLGGRVVRTLGAWDYPASPLWYKTFTQLIPRLLGVMRRVGKAQTERSLD
jgi:lipid II:glycine glycyltransferase (peptidoglycan interpeptide bridge formation enzyme)